MTQPIIIRGQAFPSIEAVAEHFGLTVSAVTSQLSQGRADSIGTGRRNAGKRKPPPVTLPPFPEGADK